MNESKFTKITLKKKLIGAFLFSSLITAVVGGIGFTRISNNINDVETMMNVDVIVLKNAEELKIQALQHRRYEKDFFLNIANPKKQSGYLKKFKSVSEKTRNLMDTMDKMIQNNPTPVPELSRTVNLAKASYERYAQGFDDVAKTVATDITITPQNANRLMEPFKSHIYGFENSVDILLKEALSQVDQKSSAIITSGRQSEIIIAILLLAGILINTGFGLSLAVVITRPVRQALEFAHQLAGGDFRSRITVRQNDEIGEMLHSMNTMSETLKTMLGSVVETAQDLSASSKELTGISDTISTNATQTADSSAAVATAAEELSTNMDGLAETSQATEYSIHTIVASTEEMTATIQEISRNTTKGSEITKEAVDKAARVTQKVNDLGQAAQAISTITETIDEISEMTHLLALNATIEAARAGEAGKGFAVVAGEIKELAEQTASATGEISNQINGIQSTTQESVAAIGQITDVINEINEIVVNMASAIEEQAVTTQEITNNVSQAATGVQDVSANVTNSSEVTRNVTRDIDGVSRAAGDIRQGSQQVNDRAMSLSKTAEMLNGLVARFKV